MTGNRDTLFIEPDDRPRLAAAGLDTVGAALQCIGDQPVAWSRSTDTVRVDLPRSAGGGALFVKRYHHLEWRRRIKAMLRGTFFGRSRAHAEFDALKHLRARGAPMVRPIAFGERRVLHFLRSSFLITQAEPDTVSLTTFAQRHTNGRAPALDPKARRRLIECLGRFVGAFHRSGLVHGAIARRTASRATSPASPRSRPNSAPAPSSGVSIAPIAATVRPGARIAASSATSTSAPHASGLTNSTASR
jgi:hypothetical protein